MVYDEATKEVAIRYRMLGMGCKDISQLIGVSERQLQNWFYEAGIPAKNGRPTRETYEKFKKVKESIAKMKKGEPQTYTDDSLPKTDEEKEACADYRRGASYGVVAQLHPSLDPSRIMVLCSRVKREMEQERAKRDLAAMEQHTIERNRKYQAQPMAGPVKIIRKGVKKPKAFNVAKKEVDEDGVSCTLVDCENKEECDRYRGNIENCFECFLKG